MEDINQYEKVDIYRGYKYAIWFHDYQGYRCGYVQIPENHPFYEQNFTEIDLNSIGLSFSGHIKGLDGWFIGWDHHHLWDVIDEDGKVTIPATEYNSKPTDEEAEIYMKSINAAFENNKTPQKVIKVHTLSGPGGGWPEAISRTTKRMTLEEFSNFFMEYIADEDPIDPEVAEMFEIKLIE